MQINGYKCLEFQLEELFLSDKKENIEELDEIHEKMVLLIKKEGELKILEVVSKVFKDDKEQFRFFVYSWREAYWKILDEKIKPDYTNKPYSDPEYIGKQRITSLICLGKLDMALTQIYKGNFSCSEEMKAKVIENYIKKDEERAIKHLRSFSRKERISLTASFTRGLIENGRENLIEEVVKSIFPEEKIMYNPLFFPLFVEGDMSQISNKSKDEQDQFLIQFSSFLIKEMQENIKELKEKKEPFEKQEKFLNELEKINRHVTSPKDECHALFEAVLVLHRYEKIDTAKKIASKIYPFLDSIRQDVLKSLKLAPPPV